MKSNYKLGLCFLQAAAALIFIQTASIGYNELASRLDSQAENAVQRGDLKLAETIYLKALAEGEAHKFEYSPNSADKLAELYEKQKRYDDAERMLLRSRAARTKEWPENYSNQLQIGLALSELHLKREQIDKAIPELKAALLLWRKAVADNDTSSGTALALAQQLSQVSDSLVRSHKPAEAEFFIQNAVIVPSQMPKDDRKYYEKNKILYMCELGKVYILNKKYKLAADVLAEVIADRQSKFQILDWELAEPMHYYAQALTALDKTAQAKQITSQLTPNWPASAFINSDVWSRKFVNGWETNDEYHNNDVASAEQAVAIASKWGPKDIRYADSEARLATILFNSSKYNQARPHMLNAINSAKQSFGENSKAVAARCEKWGSTVTDAHYTHDAPWAPFREALRIRTATATLHDTDAFNGAKLIANYCKNQLPHRLEQELFAMFEDAVAVMAKVRGTADDRVLDAYSDLIREHEKWSQYETDTSKLAPIAALYKTLLSGEKDAYGARSAEARQTAGQYAKLLKRMHRDAQAIQLDKEYGSQLP
jgi:tetratricopeptide (TPR) repeat protein